MPKMLAERCREALSTHYDEDTVEASISQLVSVYSRFLESGCADSNFEALLKSQDKATFAQRLGEMLLFERLSHAGFQLKSADSGPDFRVEKNGKVAWLELVTPSVGEDSKIGELFDSHDPLSPSPEATRETSERLLLRVCTGIEAKLSKFEYYRNKGLIKPDEACVIVVNDALLCSDFALSGVSFGASTGLGGSSLVEHAVLGLGHRYWVEDEVTGHYNLQQAFREETPNRPEPTKEGKKRTEVPVSLFTQPTSEQAQALSHRAQGISAVMQITLNAGYGYLMTLRDKAEQQDRLFEDLLFPGTLVKNPYANIALTPALEQDLRKITNLPPLSALEQQKLKQRRFDLLTGKSRAS